MAWYRTGTVTVTNGSTAVTGAGTAFVEAVLAGDAFVGPDGRTYEIAAVVSATQVTLAMGYMGSTQAGAAYAIQPTQGRVIKQNALLEALLTAYQGVYNGPGQGKFADGTAAAPGVSFLADADTGWRRVAANALALVTGGADRLQVNNAGAILTGLLTGTAVTQSDVDQTAGRLFKMGDFGWGRDVGGRMAPSNNLNNAIMPGLYDMDVSTLNRPAGMNNGIVEVFRRGNNRVAHLAFMIQSNAEPVLVTRIQYGDGTTWSPWRPLTPERGSNANGEYVRFADGTQICTHKLSAANISTASGSIFLSPTVNWTFPAAFIVAPVVSGVGGGTSRWMGGITAGVTIASLRAISGISEAGATTIEAMAIGRWF